MAAGGVMSYFVIRITQERFFVVRSSDERAALEELLNTGLVDQDEKFQILHLDFDKGLMDSRRFLTMPHVPNWKWTARSNYPHPIKRKAASAGK
jgi:hypothetical protein